MKPFSLEEYLANPSRKVVTRDGRDVRIICTDFNNPDFPVIGEIKGYKWPLSFATNGKIIKWKQLSGDLFFAPKKPKVEKFDPKTFQPFDKVLARCTESEWMPTLFGFFIDTDNKDPFSPFVNGERVVCVDIGYQQCIPYNDETKHLVGTLDDCPEFYKWWEE